jgi:hypothetical protein
VVGAVVAVAGKHNMKKRYKILLAILCTAAIAAACAYQFLPWRDIAAERLAAVLEAKGFEDVTLTIDHAGLRGAHLRDVTIGTDDPLTLRDLTLKYEWRELLDGRLRDLEVSNLDLTLRDDGNGWALQGFRKSAGDTPFALPVTTDDVRKLLPFDNMSLKNAALSVIAPGWTASIPTDVTWNRPAGNKINLAAHDATYTQGTLTATIGAINADVQMDPSASTWAGLWTIADLAVKDTPLIPPLTGGGKITAQADHIKVEGQLAGNMDKTAVSFTATQHFADPTQNAVTITQASTSFNNGTIGARNVTIPLGQKQPIRFDADVDNVAITDIVKTMFGGRATADTTVSGHVPVIYNPAGKGISPAHTAMISPAWDTPATAAHKLTITAKNAAYKQDNVGAAIASLTANIKPGKKGPPWTGTWSTGAVTLADNKTVPPLTGDGTLTIHPDHIRIDGQFADAAGQTGLRFTTAQYFAAPAKNRLTILDAAMPWKNGTLRTRNVPVPLGKKAAIRFDLIVDNVSLNDLMQAITGKRVNATGAVSGTLPLVYNPDGSIVPGNGLLDANAPGTITMPPDAIPGDNAQITLTREILSNFQYDTLAITTEQDADGKAVILLALLGKNPEVQGGRAVKLNVRLTGDVLDFVRNNVILLTSPEKLIQQDRP